VGQVAAEGGDPWSITSRTSAIRTASAFRRWSAARAALERLTFARPPDDHRLVRFSIERYAPRPIVPLGVWRHGDWRLKEYAIAYGRDRARRELIAAAEAAAGRTLPTPAVTDNRYGVGFLGIHDGRGGNFVFIDWWEQENELHHRVFFSSSDAPGSLRPATAADPIACVWDLRVVAHEREAWVRHVLAADAPDLDDYLEDTLAGVV
jgi:hypothetical protein